MFIIIGFRETRKFLGKARMLTCARCGNTNAFEVWSETQWITLFFINVIPVKTKYFVLCPICHYGQEVQKREALDMTGLWDRQK